MESDRHFDVIVVGGRPAGSTLAARLGQQGLHVLVVERATFPSLPAASCPAIYASTMRLLDEIGADETEYARGTPRLRRWVTEIRDDFHSVNQVPQVYGRDYGYAIDRCRFDDALWRNAARFPTVTTRDRFAVTELVWQGERVVGIRGRAAGGAEETFTGDLVVGADGRFSMVARGVGARSSDEHDEHPTSIYYAYWKNVEPFDDQEPCIHVFGGGGGYGFLIMDSADEQVCVAIEGRSDLFERDGLKGPDVYQKLVRQHPQVWRRLANAEQVTDVRGMRKIGNLYRQAGGLGWALVGDALHQKDPLDGQGIYDAVFTAKALSEAIRDWKQGAQSWDAALAAYDAAVRAETYPMYIRTLDRVKQEVYTDHSARAFRTYVRWLIDDPEFKRRGGLLIVRGISPTKGMPARVILRALLRGALRDIGRRIALRLRPRSLPASSTPDG